MTPRRAAQWEVNKRIGQRVRWIRDAHEEHDRFHNSQAQWATSLDIPPSDLSRYERGEKLIPVDFIITISQLSGATEQYLLYGVLDETDRMEPWLRKALKERPHQSPAEAERQRQAALRIVRLRRNQA